MKDLVETKKHLVVIGASRGLGRAVVNKFASDGWKVSFGSRNIHDLRIIESQLRNEALSANAHSVDVSDNESVRVFFETAQSLNGNIDAVVHLAATNRPYGSIKQVDPKEWQSAVNVNLMGTFNVLRNALLLMPPSMRGDIVILSGGGATSPMPTLSAYAASKAAIVRLVESVALEESTGAVRINALAPGIMDTSMFNELFSVDPGVVDPRYLEKMHKAKQGGENTMELALDCIEFLISNNFRDLTGLLISAKWDDWRTWRDSGHGDFSDPRFRLRRIISEGTI